MGGKAFGQKTCELFYASSPQLRTGRFTTTTMLCREKPCVDAMAAIADQLARELSALYAFVDAVSLSCTRPPNTVAFTEPSELFLGYIEKLAAQTKRYLATNPVRTDADDEDFLESRRELSTIRTAWRELHQFIRPAVDAHTLEQPTALVDGLVARLRRIQGFEHTDFTIFHTADFNYLQVKPSAIGRIAGPLATIVGAEAFPKDLGLIGIPYSHGSALFLNCLVAHEIGEYIFDLRNLSTALGPEVRVALEKQLHQEFTETDNRVQSQLIDTVSRWAKEIFCDLFAVGLIGPCYTFAYLELFDIVRFLGVDGKIRPEDFTLDLRFHHDHPCHMFRLMCQVRMLKALDWWPHFAPIDSRYIRLLEGLAAMEEDVFVGGNGGQGPLVAGLLAVLPEVRTRLGTFLNGLDPGVHEYSILCEPVCTYLENGVVPSSINMYTHTDGNNAVNPSAVTLLNAAFRFYLDRIERLMARLKDEDVSLLDRRVWWINRVQSWTMKALEDVRLLNQGG